MSRISFTDELPASSRNTQDQFPKLKLKLNEKARIVLLEAPFRGFVHQLYEPTIVNGKGVLVDKPARNGGTFQAYDEKFIKSFQCVGDEETVLQSGADVKNCPACHASTQYDRFKAPAPRYALNVVKYATKPGTTDLTSPYSVSVLVWAFGPQKFQQIRDLAKEGYDLRTHDLILGPCQHEDYQKYDMMVSQYAAWEKSDETKKLTKETFASNKVEDLSRVIAPQIDRDTVSALVDRVKRAWDIVNGVVVNNTEAILAASEVNTASAALAGIADDVPATGSVDETSNFEDLLKGISFD